MFNTKSARSSASTVYVHAVASEDVVKREDPDVNGLSETVYHDVDGDGCCPANSKPMNKKSLAEVALLTESEAAKMFKMGTTRFKARCRALGISRWPHRKLMSLKNLYEDLVKHLENARDAKNHEQHKRVRGMMLEIKSYARLLEADLSRLNQFYNGKKAWPENILKIRQTVYKKRHAQVLMEKKASSSKQESDVPKMGSKASSGGSYEFTELEHASAAQTENKSAMSSDASFGLREVGQKLEAHWAEDEDMWLFLARGGGAA